MSFSAKSVKEVCNRYKLGRGLTITTFCAVFEIITGTSRYITGKGRYRSIWVGGPHNLGVQVSSFLGAGAAFDGIRRYWC